MDDEAVAQELEYKHGAVWPFKILGAIIAAARRSEREECAKIAEDMCPPGGRQWDSEQLACFSALTECAANIRKRG